MMDDNKKVTEKCYTITVVFDNKEDAEWFDKYLNKLAGFDVEKAVEEFKGNWTSPVETTVESFAEGDSK
jgi:hypothetical protein